MEAMGFSGGSGVGLRQLSITLFCSGVDKANPVHENIGLVHGLFLPASHCEFY